MAFGSLSIPPVVREQLVCCSFGLILIGDVARLDQAKPWAPDTNSLWDASRGEPLGDTESRR